MGDTGAPPPTDKQTMLRPDQVRSDVAGRGLSKTDSMMERGADGGRGNSRTVGYREGNINVHVHIPEMRKMTKLPSGRMSYKSDDKRSGLKRFFKVFSPKNVGDLGGVLDPTALVILLMICLASVGMAMYNVIVALVDGYNFADIKLAAFYLGMPLSWSLSAAVAPYLFVHYCFSAGKSFTRAAATLRFFQNILAVAALAFLWLGLPPEVDVSAPQSIHYLKNAGNVEYYNGTCSGLVLMRFTSGMLMKGSSVNSCYRELTAPPINSMLPACSFGSRLEPQVCQGVHLYNIML